MTPYSDPDAGPQNKFNLAITKTTVRVEITFGTLKSCFAFLHVLRVALDQASRIIAKCVAPQ